MVKMSTVPQPGRGDSLLETKIELKVYIQKRCINTPQRWHRRIWSQFALLGNRFRVSDAFFSPANL